MATHSSILAWRIPWAEEPSGLQPMESQSEMTERLTQPAATFLELDRKRCWGWWMWVLLLGARTLESHLEDLGGETRHVERPHILLLLLEGPGELQGH